MMPLNQISFSDHMGRRLDERLIKVWNECRSGERDVPLLQDFLKQYIADMWSFLFVLHIDQQGNAATVDRIGEALTVDLAQSLDGKSISDIPEQCLLYYATRDYNVASLKRNSASSSGEFVNNNGDIVLYRSTLLPFTQEEKNISAVVGAASYRIESISAA